MATTATAQEFVIGQGTGNRSYYILEKELLNSCILSKKFPPSSNTKGQLISKANSLKENIR